MSKDQYFDEFDECALAPTEMAPDENFLFRVITHIGNPKHLADDFLVHVKGIEYCDGTTLLQAYFRMEVHPVTADGVILEEYDIEHVVQDGLAYPFEPARIPLFNNAEDGYFHSASDDIDFTVAKLLANPVQPLVPSLV
ncbi:MAG TPA: hypothetical protein VF401_01430 [Candidatus Saccharimonadales bacterium]